LWCDNIRCRHTVLTSGAAPLPRVPHAQLFGGSSTPFRLLEEDLVLVAPPPSPFGPLAVHAGPHARCLSATVRKHETRPRWQFRHLHLAWRSALLVYIQSSAVARHGSHLCALLRAPCRSARWLPVRRVHTPPLWRSPIFCRLVLRQRLGRCRHTVLMLGAAPLPRVEPVWCPWALATTSTRPAVRGLLHTLPSSGGRPGAGCSAAFTFGPVSVHARPHVLCLSATVRKHGTRPTIF